MSTMSGDTVADLRRCVAELQRELDERTAKSEALQLELTGAGEQQTAAAEVLQVINSSHGELAPVFGAVLDRALALCCAAFGVLWRYDGGLVRAAAIRGATPEYADFLTRGPIGRMRAARTGAFLPARVSSTRPMLPIPKITARAMSYPARSSSLAAGAPCSRWPCVEERLSLAAS
jgi:hypothetical protein